MSSSPITQIAHVCIFARDLAATEAFYRDVLGLRRAFTFKRGDEEIGYYLALGQRTFIEVFKKDESRFSETDQINHICLETEDIDGFVRDTRAKGVEVTDKKLGVDGTWQAWLTDPNGVKLEIFQYTKDSLQFAAEGAVAQVTW